jgi:hypothetical protein
MAAYKYPGNFVHLDGPAFDQLLPPGFRISISGIYRCTQCGDEVAANKGDPLPPQNRHQHKNPLLPIQWKLVVAAQQVA